MCLALPGEVLEIDVNDPLRTARISFGGVVQTAALACVPEAEVGDYVIVHAGFAISRVDPAEARQTLADLASLRGA